MIRLYQPYCNAIILILKIDIRLVQRKIKLTPFYSPCRWAKFIYANIEIMFNGRKSRLFDHDDAGGTSCQLNF